MSLLFKRLQKPSAYALAFLALLLLISCTHTLKPSPPASDLYPNEPRAEIDNIYVLGDSLSDTGNLFSLINNLFLHTNIRMEVPPASLGGQKFSNGYLVVEYIAAHYDLDLEIAWEPTSQKKKALKHINAEDVPGLTSWLTSFNNNGEAHQKHHEAITLISENLGRKAKGNNYAVTNATIIPYKGVLNRFFGQFSLAKQVDLHQSEPIEKIASPNTLHFLIIGGNDIMMAMNMNSNQSAKEQKIRRIALAYVEQIERLQKIGAKKILVSTAPKIGDIPEFYNTSSRDQANHLSELLEQEVSQQIKQRFNDNQVAFVSLSEILNQELNKWPQQRQHQACVRDIASDYFNLEHFILHDGELTIKFINDCTQSALTNGSFVYYDGFHGTDKLYQLIARHLHQRHQYTDAMSSLS